MGKNDGSEEGITHTEREQSGASPVCSFAEAPRRQTEPLARFGGVVCSLAPAPLQARVCMFQPRRWSHPKGQKRRNRASGRPLGEVSPLRNHSPKRAPSPPKPSRLSRWSAHAASSRTHRWLCAQQSGARRRWLHLNLVCTFCTKPLLGLLETDAEETALDSQADQPLLKSSVVFGECWVSLLRRDAAASGP